MQIQCLTKSGFCSKAVFFNFYHNHHYYQHSISYISFLTLFCYFFIFTNINWSSINNWQPINWSPVKQVLPNTELGIYDKMVKKKSPNFWSHRVQRLVGKTDIFQIIIQMSLYKSSLIWSKFMVRTGFTENTFHTQTWVWGCTYYPERTACAKASQQNKRET